MHQLPSFLLMCNAGMKVCTVLSYLSCPKDERGSAACVCISKSSNNTAKQASSLTFMSCQMFLLLLHAFLNLQCGCVVYENGIQRTSCHSVWSHPIFTCHFLLRGVQMKLVTATRFMKWEVPCWVLLAPCCGRVAYVPRLLHIFKSSWEPFTCWGCLWRSRNIQ